MFITIQYKFKVVLSLIVILLLQACSNLHPIPTTEYIDLTTTQTEISQIDNREDLLDLISKGRNKFKNQTVYIYKKMYSSSDVSYVGTVAGLLGGVTSSIETVIAGSALTVGGTVIPERYALAVQGDNYKKITRAYSCVLREVNHVDDGNFNLYEHKKATIYTITLILSELDYALFDRQLRVELTEPSVDALVDAVNTSRESNKNSEKIIEAKGNKSLVDDDLQIIHQALIDRVRVCAAKFTAIEN